MKRSVITFSVLGLLVSSLAMAEQPVRNQGERARDRQDLRQNDQEQRDDRRDLVRLEGVLVKFNTARASRNMRALDEVDRELQEILARELAEGQKELARDKQEVKEDSRELRSDRREQAADRATGAGRGATANDGHDRRDDRRDRADDRLDARKEAAMQQERRQVAMRLNALNGARQPAALMEKHDLIEKLISLSKRELKQDRVEDREDHREIREDRRETREDRR